MDASIIVFAKRPVPGRVKTRLCPPLSPERAAELYRAFARDAWRAAAAVAGARALAAVDEGDAEWLGQGTPFIRQKGKDLGERLHNAILDALAGAPGKCVVIGSDCPTLTAADLALALRRLERHDLVLGPARDGGYYLIGLTRPRPELLRGLRWSRPDVLAETLSRARALGLRWSLLRPRRDVDEHADLLALRRARAPMPFTRRALRAGLALLLLLPAVASAKTVLVDDFSAPAGADGLPPGWKHVTFRKVPRATRWTLEPGAARAESAASASALAKAVRVSLAETPRLRWRWKVDRVLASADGGRKSGDDYAARVYVAFSFDPARATRWEKATYGLLKALYGSYPPKATLSYVWDGKNPVGASWDNPYTARVKVVVAESGSADAGRWVEAERDVAADYRRLFGGEPPPVAFVGIMSDTDDTKESATAWFGPLAFEDGGAEEFR